MFFNEFYTEWFFSFSLSGLHFILWYTMYWLDCLIANVNGQTCRGMSQYSSCSSNGECGCLQYSFNNNYGICGILTSSCSQFVPCQTPFDACSQGHVCVRHPRCDSRSLCYPMSLGQQNRCPPVIGKITKKNMRFFFNYFVWY